MDLSFRPITLLTFALCILDYIARSIRDDNFNAILVTCASYLMSLLSPLIFLRSDVTTASCDSSSLAFSQHVQFSSPSSP